MDRDEERDRDRRARDRDRPEGERGGRAVVGVFQDRNRAERAVEDLRAAGFKQDQIGFVTPDRGSSGGEKTGSHAGGGAAAGLVTGGVLGGIAGAIAAGLIPGVGPLIAGGILAVTAGGAAAGAAAGGLLGALIGLGIPEREAKYYEGEVKSGRTLVTVKADGREAEAASILRRHGAYDIEDQGGRDMRDQGYAAQEEPREREPARSGYRTDRFEEANALHVTVTPDEVIIRRRPQGGPASSRGAQPQGYAEQDYGQRERGYRDQPGGTGYRQESGRQEDHEQRDDRGQEEPRR